MKTETQKLPPQLPVGFHSDIPEAPFTDPTLHNHPTDDRFTDGLYRDNRDGIIYALCVHEPDAYFRTHTLKNSAYTLDCMEAEFRQNFTKA